MDQSNITIVVDRDDDEEDRRNVLDQDNIRLTQFRADENGAQGLYWVVGGIRQRNYPASDWDIRILIQQSSDDLGVGDVELQSESPAAVVNPPNGDPVPYSMSTRVVITEMGAELTHYSAAEESDMRRYYGSDMYDIEVVLEEERTNT